MKELVLNEDLARKFLLGELSPEQQGDIEEQAFLDAESFEFLEAAAEDLIDEFLYDDLSADEKERFRAHFLSGPGRRADLKIARALQQHVTQLPAPAGKLDHDEKTSWRDWLKLHFGPLRLSLATALLVITVLTGVWLALRILRQNRPAPVQVQKQTVETPTPLNQGSETPPVQANLPTPKEDQPKPAPSTQPRPAVYAFVLIPGGPVRGEGSVTTVKVPAAGIARLELPLIEDTAYRSYQATLESDGGEVIHSWTGLRIRVLQFGKGIEISVPAALLEQQKFYRVRLRGVSTDRSVHEIGSYHFQVTN